MFIVQLGYGVTDQLQLGFATLLPIIEGTPFLANLSAKFRYFGSPRLKLAALGTFTYFGGVDGTAATLGHAASYCLDDECDNLLNATVIANLQMAEGAVAVLWMGGAGASVRLARHVRLLAEFGTAGVFAFSTTSNDQVSETIPGGAVTYGVRLFGGDLAADLLFVKPVSTTGAFADFPLPMGFPVVNVSVKF